LASCPTRTQAASLDIAKAYQNSPILPAHKKYLCILWKGTIYVQHVTIKSLETAGGIQGSIADATIAILKHHSIELTIKWVDDFIFFRSPSISVTSGPSEYFSFDLSSILNITKPLGIPWHRLSKKGHDFQQTFNYVGFTWDIASRSVSLPSDKHLRLLNKVSAMLISPAPLVNKCTVASIHSSLQHMTVVYQQGHSSVCAIELSL